MASPYRSHPLVATQLTLDLGIPSQSAHLIHYQLTPDELISQSLENGEGVLSDKGALVIETGVFTGRSPKDRYIVKEDESSQHINWNEFNIPIEQQYFDRIYAKILDHLKDRPLWIRDCLACAKPQYQIHLRVINENPCCNLFAYNMFLRPDPSCPTPSQTEWHLIHVPHFAADPTTDGTRQPNFVIIHFSKKIILIGGTQYTGEIKKSIFSTLNFLLPPKGVLSMHCSANIGKAGDTSIFFGLSGTGKTTLSADPNRFLIGDDEHGWDEEGVFNIEGGCYAKTIDLSPQKEPEIYRAIRHGALLENVNFTAGTKCVDYSSRKITENTRASYPINYIQNIVTPSIGGHPQHIFFLTADAYGILPPISRLTPGQAMYQFLSGYTAKVAGTESGILEPKPTFSTCFGAPFLPLSPVVYAEMLGKKIKAHQAKVWLINTGWNGGGYGVGSRIKLEYTRAMISAVLEGKLDQVAFFPHSIFGFMMPERCPGVPSEILSAKFTWVDKEAYVNTARLLARYFIENFEQYKPYASEEILAAAPFC